MHHRLQKQGWGHTTCPPAWGCVVDSDMMELALMFVGRRISTFQNTLTNTNINAFNGTWLSKYFHHNKPHGLINVRVRRGRSTLSMFLCYKQFIYIYIEDGSRCICSATRPVSCVLCHVSTCDNVSRASAHRCQGWLLHCGYIHINSDHNLGPCTLYLVAGCNV